MPSRLRHHRILVVEDHRDSREILEEMLRFYGATVWTVSTAREAFALLPGADIVVTDYALPPGQDGVWLLEQVNREPRPVPGHSFERLLRDPGRAIGRSPVRTQAAQAHHPREAVRGDRRTSFAPQD